MTLGCALQATKTDLDQEMALSKEGFLRIRKLLKRLVRCGGYYGQIRTAF